MMFSDIASSESLSLGAVAGRLSWNAGVSGLATAWVLKRWACYSALVPSAGQVAGCGVLSSAAMRCR